MAKGKKAKKNLKTVSFDEEIITKESAGKLLSKLQPESEVTKGDKSSVEKENLTDLPKNDLNSNETVGIKSRKSKRKKSNKSIDESSIGSKKSQEVIQTKGKKRKLESNQKQDVSNEASTEDPNGDSVEFKEKKIKQKKKKAIEVEPAEQPDTTDEVSVENPKVKTSESIRAQKRKKHAKLLEEKRLKAELAIQQNTLNYLSKWKHCRSEWKFEKLKQIWLQQNLFDTSKIPNEFWEIAVEYFNGSKGAIRKVILKDALKIIDKEETSEEENTDENYLLVLKRARDIVQNLQE